MKRLISLFISLILIVSSGTISFGQAVDSDYENNWAKDAISYMIGKDILLGYPDGTFRPENIMKRCEFYKFINSIIRFTKKDGVNFDDVKSTDWYYGEVEKGMAANYLLATKSLNPKDNITIEEVAKIIGIVFGIVKDEAIVTAFSDDGIFRPKAEMTRAEVVKMLHNISGEIINVTGIFNKDIETNLLVNVADVVLKDMVIEGDLYLTEGIGDGDITLDNVEVKGILSVKGGGANSVIIKNSKINIVSIDKQSELGKVVIENTTVEEIRTLEGVKVGNGETPEKESTPEPATPIKVNDNTSIGEKDSTTDGILHAQVTAKLILDIAVAQSLHDRANEGTAFGEYVVGSKIILQGAINNAQAVVDSGTKIASEAIAAELDLGVAVGIFEAGKEVKYKLILTGDNISSYPNTVKVDKDTSITVIVVPKIGQQVASFTVGGEDKKADLVAGTPNEYIFIITGDTEVSVIYESKLFTVTFKDYDNRVIKTVDIRYGEDAVLPTNPERAGYTFASWDGTYTKIAKSETVIATYTPNAKTTYTVKHYTQTSDKKSYIENEKDSTRMEGLIGAETVAVAKNYLGFTVRPFDQKTIAANGSTLVRIFYDR